VPEEKKEPKESVTTVNWPKKLVEEFDIAYRKSGFRSRAHYFDLAGRALIEQVNAGEKILFPPLRLVTEKPLEKKKPVKQSRNAAG